jgi:glycosyltransferase involved in cell wall biosynthesis
MKNVGLRPDDLYQKADIFVYPSVVESFGHPLIEAMAQGLPIVAADVPINREICRDAALFFDPFNPGACAATIEALLDNHDLRAEMSRRSLRRSQDFHWHEHISRLVELLRGELSPSEMEGVTASVPQVLGLSQP